MSRIRVMPPELSNRIAAGEVIERPASVVKELVENALDAGATSITVSVEGAGVRLISVADNGCGMDPEDAALAFEVHGTSKLLSAADLERISTLGFRGEAIPSIAAVSRLVIRTRRAEDGEGVAVSVEGGKNFSCTPCGGAPGTTVEMRDLFFNTPGRKKFLKSAPTEEHHIEETLINIALGNFRTAFTLWIDRRKAFSCMADATPEIRVREFFGRNFAANMKKVEHREGGIRIWGLVAAPGFTRPSRKEQRIYLNGRPVEALPVWKGIREGYGTIENESGRFPPALLFLEMAPEEFDVNVHPAKREVRFKSEFVLTRAVASAVRRALHEEKTAPVDALPPAPLAGKIGVEEILRAAETVYRPNRNVQVELETFAPEAVRRPWTETSPPDDQGEIRPEEKTSLLTDRTAETEAAVKIRAAIPENAAFSGQWPERVLGIYDDTYILAEGNGTLILVDQHAAHERILFEEILDRAASGGVASQLLLIGQMVELPPAQIALISRYKDVFSGLGFDFEMLGGKSVLVNAIPGSFDGHAASVPEIVEKMLDELLENARAQLPVNAEFAARAACKAAVKAHGKISAEEAAELLKRLRSCRQGTLCPHGRPTMIALTKNELEKRFQRR